MRVGAEGMPTMEFLRGNCMYRFHLISLAHLPQSKEYMSCAFTQKNRKLAKMLIDLGHEVYFYGSEGSDVEEYCNSDKLHFIQTHTIGDIRNDYGVGDNRFELGYDWTDGDFKHDFDSERKPSTLKFYDSCVEQIQKNKHNDDFLLLSQGLYYDDIRERVGLFLTCEFGIGYRGSNKNNFRAFESSYIQNYTYGYENQLACANGSYYDRVIPNYFDKNDITFSDKKKDYYLFIGRMIKRKGIITAILACNATGKKLVLVGQGAYVDAQGHLLETDHAGEYDIPPGTWEYQGYADLEKRKKLMAEAIAVFTPTEYLECFAGTHVEAMLSGTPVITTNFGVFPGTIPDHLNGVVGFRCNTLDDFVKAAKKAKSVDHKRIRKYAERFLMENVANDYQKWFNDLYNVYESATDQSKKGWHRIGET
jgi:glycosyltransferase involved in cell wall biosynthesis